VKRVGRLPRRPRNAEATVSVPAQMSLPGPALPIRDSNRLLPTPAVDAVGLTYRYRAGTDALHVVDLSIPQGGPVKGSEA
jgi:hypothetical protein